MNNFFSLITTIDEKMASPSKVSMKELMDSCGLQDASLEREVASVQLNDLSSYLTKWKLIAPKWEISENEVVAIEHDNQGDLQMQSISFLHKWKQGMSLKATYKVLVSALMQGACVQS